MDETRENLTCLRVADLRESESALPEELHSHASSCAQCIAVEEVSKKLLHYEPPSFPFSSEQIWQKIPVHQSTYAELIPIKRKLVSFFQVRYAAAAAVIILLFGILFMLSNRKPEEVAVQTPQRILSPTVASNPTAIITKIAGEAFIRQGAEWKPLHVRDGVAALSTLRVSKGGNLRFTFPGQTEVVMVERSEGTIKSIASGSHSLNSIYLAYGKAFIHHRGNTFAILTPQASIEAIGTDFSVRFEGNTTHVRVFNGRVRLHSASSVAFVGREEELRFAPKSKGRVRRFRLRDSEDWEQSEFHVIYFNHGRMVSKPIHPRFVSSPPTSLTKTPAVHYYDSHLNRRAVKNEEQIRVYDEKVRKTEDDLLREQQKHDESITPPSEQNQ